MISRNLLQKSSWFKKSFDSLSYCIEYVKWSSTQPPISVNDERILLKNFKIKLNLHLATLGYKKDRQITSFLDSNME